MVNDDPRDVVEVLLRHQRDMLTEWEERFVLDVEEKLRQGRDLTLGQSRKLDEIAERCARGYGR